MSKRILSLLLTMTLLLSIPVLPASAQEEGEEVEAATIYLWTAWTPEAGIQEMIEMCIRDRSCTSCFPSRQSS